MIAVIKQACNSGRQSSRQVYYQHQHVKWWSYQVLNLMIDDSSWVLLAGLEIISESIYMLIYLCLSQGVNIYLILKACAWLLVYMHTHTNWNEIEIGLVLGCSTIHTPNLKSMDWRAFLSRTVLKTHSKYEQYIIPLRKNSDRKEWLAIEKPQFLEAGQICVHQHGICVFLFSKSLNSVQ